MKAKDTVSKLDFGIPEIPDSRFAEFGHLEPDITDFVNTNNKGNGTFPKLDFSRLSVNSSIAEITNSRFSDFGNFEPDITVFVKNLIREMTASQNWIFAV